ncbi:MAG: NAD(P)H-hydrate dehydratase [Planctomycetes bacterium]|nr:NAD(P)H-hydrate dehydratase [Planctomycetota bacterium]
MERITQTPELPARDPLGHKATFGRVCVVGGSCGERPMIGAPALAARAALRSGCGLCAVAVPAPILQAVLAVVPAATGVALPVDAQGQLFAAGCAEAIDQAIANIDALVVGPGFGHGLPQQQIVIRLASSFGKPLVLDADALRALAQLPDFARDLKAPIILTPHPGEFDALAHALHLDLNAVSEETRDAAALAMAGRLGCIVILKGAHTRVSDGVRVWRSPHAEAALAIGGSGDVLSGVTGAFAAQFANKKTTPALDLFQVACLAVHVHALTAEAWSKTHGHAGLLPEELADGIPAVMANLRGELND